MSLRLPESVRPISYNLLFEPDLTNFKFSGTEEIELDVNAPTSEIILNSKDLKVKICKVENSGLTIEPKVELDNEKERLVLRLNKNISGKTKLRIDFEGDLNDSLSGFYRSKYKDKNGNEKYLATTQFEAPYARRAFPCFDEPNYKATFDVSMRIDKDLQAISNMPIIKEVNEGGKKLVRFDRSPRMSTYLLYLGAGDFEFLEEKHGEKTIRIVTTRGKREQAGFALDLAKKFLSYFEEYSKIPYPLPKLDLIAVPDFASGAMENWGAITFREVLILFDQKTTSIRIKKRIAEVIAHELWHQWSGNLVTMKWWNDLWLNESFATYMAYKAIDRFYPEWSIWEDFVNMRTAPAFADDSLKSTHPIEVDIKDPKEIEEVFDNISYGKGGSVLRMIDEYLGHETFRKGVSEYLSKYKYENAASEDLWFSLAEASKNPIEDVMMSWLRQAGHPLIDAKLVGNEVLLKQSKFVFDQKESSKWMIPLVMRAGDTTLTEIVSESERTVKLPEPPSWIKLNYGQSGFYRVKYDEKDIEKLKPLISEKELPPLDRWGIQNDLFHLSLNGQVTVDRYLDFIKCYEKEDNYLVLSDIYSNLLHIHNVFSQETFWPNIWPAYRNYLKTTYKNVLNKLGWENKEGESTSDALLRGLAIRYLGFVEDEETVSKGRNMFEKFLENKPLAPDIKYPVLYIAASTGDEETYNKIAEVYVKTQSPEEKVILLQALGQFKSKELAKKSLDFSLSDKVRMQDVGYTMYAVASNPSTREVFLPWVSTNWKKIDAFKKSGHVFMGVVEDTISSCLRNEKDLTQFLKTHPIEYKMVVNRSLEKLRMNIRWLDTNKTALNKYFG